MKNIKIGIYDNLANNAYNLVKALRQAGCQAELIMNASDTFAMSQPLWEDCDFTLETTYVINKRPSPREWRKRAALLRWQKPEWINETYLERSFAKRLWSIIKNPSSSLAALQKINIIAPLIISKANHIINKMKEYDLLLAFGVGPVYAYFSQKPYIALVYGGDLTLTPFLDGSIYKRTVAQLQKTAYRNARYVCGLDPYYKTYLEKLGLIHKWSLMSLLVDTNKYRPLRIDAREILDPQTARLIENKFVFFMPSRSDFYWKGTDKALRAFARLVKINRDVLLIATGWGIDLDRAQKLAEELDLKDNILFLPVALSKIRLIKFFNIAHAVLDQFNLKTVGLSAVGTSAWEAMACAKPILANNTALYAENFPTSPPIISVANENEIFGAMAELTNNPQKAKRIGESSREWVIQNLGFKSKMTEKIINLCQQSFNN